MGGLNSKQRNTIEMLFGVLALWSLSLLFILHAKTFFFLYGSYMCSSSFNGLNGLVVGYIAWLTFILIVCMCLLGMYCQKGHDSSFNYLGDLAIQIYKTKKKQFLTYFEQPTA